ncbi:MULTISPECIES: hypothetical protein [Acinetobacter]|uniref:hypothetical protein n=1 Tax=Acinetobacter TaxID=469 RepID=UPI0015D40E61|nr:MULTISPECIES: hypothetical protein [Acinetobacter]QSG85119.1 hypothetical protein JYB86_03080 [Acinetobacter indicus]
MDKLILKLMFEYRWYTTFFFAFIYFILLVVFIGRYSFSDIVGSIIFFSLLLMALWNVSFLMLKPISISSGYWAVLGRGVFIFSYLIGFIFLMVF